VDHVSLGVRRSFGIGARELAAASCASLDHRFGDGDEAELWIAQPGDEAIAIGAFGRASGIDAATVVRRGSGGPVVRVGEGTLWIALLLPSVSALVSCDEPRIVNRYVRPLLRALTKCGALAHFFGRDWISVKHRPAAWTGFAHDRASGRTTFEAFVACDTRFDVESRASFLGKEPGTLASILGAPFDVTRLADAIVASYADAYGRAAIDRGPIPTFPIPPDDPRADPPWLATVDEVIGIVGAGPDALGTFRVGGDLLVSRDALTSLESSLAGTRDEDLPALIDAALAAPHTAIDGIRSLDSLREAILAARAQNLA
jgi:hypothetical protein